METMGANTTAANAVSEEISAVSILATHVVNEEINSAHIFIPPN
jgi:hypothetical protein